MYEPPLHAHSPIMFLLLAAPSQKHRKNARATPIFFSDQYTIRSPVTKNPPSRNRKTRFASPQKQSTFPSATAPALMSLEATRTPVRGRSRAAALCVSYVNLCSLCSRGKRLTQTLHLMSFCPYVLLFPALAAAQPRLGVSPSVLRVSGLSPNH